MAAGLSFELLACRLTFYTDGMVRFPDRASNTFRGALGFVLPEQIFRPRLDGGPSGLADAPRLFVLQAKELDGRTVAGSSFGFDLNLFDPSLETEFKRAFQTLAERGITPSRTQSRLESWESRRVVIRLDEVEPVTRLHVHFETPTELKGWDGNGSPPFGVLACRLRDRVSGLRALYGAGPLEIDFKGFGERAKRVVATGGRLVHECARRTSSRTGMSHPLGGVTGWVEYEGELGEFVPYLRAAAYTGVGRQTVWGHGRLKVEKLG